MGFMGLDPKKTQNALALSLHPATLLNICNVPDSKFSKLQSSRKMASRSTETFDFAGKEGVRQFGRGLDLESGLERGDVIVQEAGIVGCHVVVEARCPDRQVPLGLHKQSSLSKDLSHHVNGNCAAYSHRHPL